MSTGKKRKKTLLHLPLDEWLRCRTHGIGGSDAALVQQYITGKARQTAQEEEKEAGRFDHG